WAGAVAGQPATNRPASRTGNARRFMAATREGLAAARATARSALGGKLPAPHDRCNQKRYAPRCASRLTPVSRDAQRSAYRSGPQVPQQRLHGQQRGAVLGVVVEAQPQADRLGARLVVI